MSQHRSTSLHTVATAFMQTAETRILAAVARSELDLHAVARQELAARGLDRQGRWVGFEQAAALANQLPVIGPNGQRTYVSIPEKD